MRTVAEILAASSQLQQLLHVSFVQNPDQDCTRTKSDKLITEISGVHCCFSPCLYLLKCSDSRHQHEVLAIGLQQVTSMQ